MKSRTQGDIFGQPEPVGGDHAAEWLGIVVDNRRLFDALQDGWLRPAPPDTTGLLVGVNGHFRDDEEQAGNRIRVWVRVDIDKLPDLEVGTHRDGQWQAMPLSEVAATDSAVSWPAALPLFSSTSFAVSSKEEQVRLASMAKRISNVELPDVGLGCPSSADLPKPDAPQQDIGTGVAIPEAVDRVRGAISMAIWAVPRITPWLELLAEALICHARALPKLARAVDARWWRFPPWALPREATPTNSRTSVQERLWLAALHVLGGSDRLRPGEALDRIATFATDGLSDRDVQAVESWRRATHEILRGEVGIEPGIWHEQPVGLAIQLVLLRPDPLAFKTWFDGGCELAPGVAWSAAALCGLFHGYRRLDTRFRGKEAQREVVAIHALRLCSDAVPKWPGMTEAPPKWQRGSGRYTLSWGGRDIVCRHEQARGKWYNADLRTKSVREEAISLAKQQHWPCMATAVVLKKGRKAVSGTGTVEADERAVTVRGGDTVMRLAPRDEVVEVIDEDEFRRHVAVEPGRLPLPPQAANEGAEDRVASIDGLTLKPEFITDAEEAAIIEEIDHAEWSVELQRRVQHYGWRYDYRSKQIDPSMHLGPLPAWAGMIAERLVDADYFRDGPPDQVIVNEYCGDQGISRHVDSPSSFTGVVAMISLLETWEMVFRERDSKAKVAKKLERRSVTILEGDARYRWTHEIPKRKNEPGPVKPGNKGPSKVPRKRRLSLTFRKVKPPTTDAPPT